MDLLRVKLEFLLFGWEQELVSYCTKIGRYTVGGLA